MAISPILGIDSDALPDKVLVVGDPGRVEKVGEHLTGSEWLGRNREYHSLIGQLRRYFYCRGLPWRRLSRGGRLL